MAPILEKTKSWAIYRDEIERQGAALQKRLPAIAAQADQIAARIAKDLPALLYLIGSGDSYIAAVSCQYAFRELAKIPSFAIEAFDVAPYHAPLLGPDSLLISTSISGRTRTATASLKAARDRGARTLLITNTPVSPAAELVDYVLELDVPSIDSGGFIPSTMSYMAGMIAQLCLALAFAERRATVETDQASRYRRELAYAIAELDGLIEAHDQPVKRFAYELGGRTPFLIGGGACYGTALFAEAKIIESAMIPVSVQHVEEWAHIRRFLTGECAPSIFLATPGHSRERMLQIMRDARAKNTHVVAIAETSDLDVSEIAHEIWPVPALTCEVLQPLTCAIPMQLLAYWCMLEQNVRPFHADISPIQTSLTLPPG